MKRAYRWKLMLGIGLLALLAACAPRQKQTQFAKNKEADAGKTYTEDQLRAALGSSRYDALIMGVGADNLNVLAYGLGISNLTQLMNSVTTPGKLTALMSDGPNSTKLTSIEVLDFLGKLDAACHSSASFLPNGNDTIMKMARLVDGVSVAGMEGIKNILHGVQIQNQDAFGAPYTTNAVNRIAMLVALLNENAAPSIMAQLINNIAAPGGTFSADGTAKLIRMVNNTRDLWSLFVIIDQTTNVANITDVMLGLSGGMYCDKPWYLDKSSCDTNAGPGKWHNTNCSTGSPASPYTDKASCESPSGGNGTWTSDGIENMTQTINQLNKTCSNGFDTNAKACRGNGAVWYTVAEKIPVIVNNITNVQNMYTIVNGLTNDGAAYSGGTPDGVDTMVATLNNIYNGGMGDTGTYAIYGKNGVKRLAYLINQLDPNPQFGNDSDFENGGSCSNTAYETQAACTAGGATWEPAGTCSNASFKTQTTCTSGGGTWTAAYNCTTGNFDNRLNWAFSDNGQAAAPWSGKSFTTGGGTVHQGSCSLRNDNTAATSLTATQSAEIILNISTTGNMTFQHSRAGFGGADIVRFFDNDVLVTTFTGNAAFAQYSYNVTTTGIHRFRFDVHRAIGSTGQLFLDTVSVPGTKGAGRTAAQKTFIMMNNLYLANSINNVATLINTASAPACVTTPLSCSMTYDNGLDTLIHVVNRSEYPVSLATTPRLAVTVNAITNLTEMTDILNLGSVVGTAPRNQLVAMMDYVQTPSNIPDLVNALGVGGGGKTATILTNITGAGTANMLRMLANTPAGAPVADVATLINGATTTAHIGQILTDLSLSGNTNIAGVETYFASPTAGAKLAQFFNQVNTKAATVPVQDCVSAPAKPNNNFCIKNHVVRLVNDIATSGAGPLIIAQIVGGLRPNAGPGGNVGVDRMVNVLYALKTMNATYYTDALSNTTLDVYGRLTTLIKDMGGNGGVNVARLINEIQDDGTPSGYLTSRLAWMVQNVNRIRYLSRLMSELTNMDLMIQLLNHASTDIVKIDTLVDTQGNNTATYPTADPSPKYGAAPSGAGCTSTDCDTNTVDKLGRLIHMINNITAISNTVTLVSTVSDIGYISYLLDGVTRVKYLTHIVNNLTNVDLMVKILNGANACSIYDSSNNTDLTDTQANCTAISGAVWSGVGRCKTNPAQTTVDGCGAANWEGADRTKLLALVNGLGNSELKGNVDEGDLVGAGAGTKAIGDQFVLYDTVNQLGYLPDNVTPRSLGQQMRVVRVINEAQYCGLKPQYDKRIQNGPTCVNASNVIQPGYQFEEACTAVAGLSWKAKYNSTNSGNCSTAGGTWLTDGCWIAASTVYNSCNDASYQKPSGGSVSTGVYYGTGDRYDGRNRLVTMMLGVTNGDAFSIVVGDVQNTSKTINMVNGVRRIRTLSQFVKWTPGAVTAALVNNTQPPAVLRSLVYLANNLEDTEDETARAFASMVHFGVRIRAQGADAGIPASNCLEFTGLGPRRLAAVLNLEAGPYLEGLVSNLGWQMSTAAMNCGWARDANENTGAGQCTNTPEDGNTGGMFKAVGASYAGNPKPSGNQCVRPRELTAGFRYGNHTWSGGTQGVRQQNCQSLMPELTGASGFDDDTDRIIWNGLGTIAGDVDDGMGINNCTGSCADIWSVLKGNGSGIVGDLMNSNSSYVGLPPRRVYSDAENDVTGLKGGNTTACTDQSGDNNNNWQCIREGLGQGDLRPGDAGNGYYWGTYCSAGNTSAAGSISGAAGSQALGRSCVANGGTWKTEKNYQGPSCNLDPSLGVKLGP